MVKCIPGPWDHIETLSRAKYASSGTFTAEAVECQRALAERDKMKVFLMQIDETWGKYFDTDEEYPGSDAVEDMIGLVEDVRRILGIPEVKP